MANNKHFMYGTPTYKSWSEMKERCKKQKGCYKNITYYKEWEDFKEFYKDMGKRPIGTTLDRINVYGNYEPSNCRWATYEIQANNKTNNKYYNIENKKLTLSQIARKYNISRSNLANKIYIYKMNINEAITYLLLKKEGGYHSTKKDV